MKRVLQVDDAKDMCLHAQTCSTIIDCRASIGYIPRNGIRLRNESIGLSQDRLPIGCCAGDLPSLATSDETFVALKLIKCMEV